MNNDEKMISLLDDEGQVHNFEVLDAIQTDDGRFVALLPIGDAFEEEMGNYYIFEVIEEDGEEQLAEVEDDELVDALAEIFEERFETIFDDEEEYDEEYPEGEYSEDQAVEE